MLCTANVARSPLLAELLRSAAARRGRRDVEVVSAGVNARVGDPAATGSRQVAQALGLSLDEHRSMPVTMVETAGASLVIAMSRAQRTYVQRRYPELAERTFALRELLALMDRAEVDGSLPDAEKATSPGSRDRLRAVAAAAHAHRPVRGRRRLDVPDPIGAPHAAYDAMAEEFAHAADALADVLFGPEAP